MEVAIVAGNPLATVGNVSELGATLRIGCSATPEWMNA